MTPKERKQEEIEERILHLIETQSDYTWGDIQGIVTAIVKDCINFQEATK